MTPFDIEPVLNAFFGDNPAYAAWRNDLIAQYGREFKSKRNRKPLPGEIHDSGVAGTVAHGRQADQAPAPVLGFLELDALPVDRNWKFQQVRFGEGSQRVTVDGETLVYLPADTLFLRENGTPKGMVEFAPPTREACERLAQTNALFVPHAFQVIGGKRDPDWEICIHICTDIPYGSAIDARSGRQFEMDCGLCLGGMAAFINEKGEPRPRNYSEPYVGSGCAAVMVAVAYRGGVPQCRSRSALIIRKGIRYPDDVLFSDNGRSFASMPDNIPESRFFFQSRETKGNSTDIYVCDYNGANLCNINADDESAWDGFHDATGREVAAWTEDGRIRFCSTVRGRGYAEIITRPDCQGRSDTHEPGNR